MQQDLVDERGWISKEDYLEGLALAQLAPGPLAAQLAIYLGYIRAGVLGASYASIVERILESFLTGGCFNCGFFEPEGKLIAVSPWPSASSFCEAHPRQRPLHAL
jgi:hypothetical protein